MCGSNCRSLTGIPTSGKTAIPSTLGKGVLHIWFCEVHVAEAQGRVMLDEEKICIRSGVCGYTNTLKCLRHLFMVYSVTYNFVKC